MKKMLMGAAALCVASVSQATVIDDFSGDLSNYTMTRVLNNSGGVNDLAGVINSEALDFTSTVTAGAADQYAFTYNGLSLAVGEEVQVDISWAKTMSGTGSEAVGLYVGKTPVDGVREDYVSVYLNDTTDIKARGFNGTEELSNATATGAATALFIARSAATDWEVGYYEGEVRNVMSTRTGMDAANDGSAVGFYIDTRGIGSIGTMDNLATNAIIVVPVTAEIDASTTSGVAPLEVVFSATNSVSIEPIASYNWDFGDGNSAMGSVVTNTFVSIGTYTVELTVVDTLSNSNSVTLEINATDVPVDPEIILIDDFSGDLSNYTMTRILNNSGGVNDTTGVINNEALDFTVTAHEGAADQYAFIYNGLSLAVGDEIKCDIAWAKTLTGTASSAVGLYVGKTPANEVREDYVTIYLNSETALKARGFDGTAELVNTTGNATDATALFIARTAASDFEVGTYAGTNRTVLVTRVDMDPANDASAVGFYIDTRGTGSIGTMDNLSLLTDTPPEPPAVGDVSIDVISAGTEVELSFLTSDNGSYGVEARSSMTLGTWDNIITNIPGTGSEVMVTNPVVSGLEFYRAYIED